MVFVAALLACAATAASAQLPPNDHWRTIHTRHFRVHFTATVEEQAKKHPRFKGNTGAFTQYLRGIAVYLNMVQPEHGAALLLRVKEIVGGEVDGSTGEKGGGA